MHMNMLGIFLMIIFSVLNSLHADYVVIVAVTSVARSTVHIPPMGGSHVGFACCHKGATIDVEVVRVSIC